MHHDFIELGRGLTAIDDCRPQDMFNHRHVLLTLFLVEKFSDLSTAVLHRVLTRVLVYDALSALALRTDAGSFM